MRKTILKSFISLMIFIFSYSAFANDVNKVYQADMDTFENVGNGNVDPFVLNPDTMNDYEQVFHHQMYNHNELVLTSWFF
ncbi:hypothetical protein [Bartonella melophagi]|uniref:Uncharacterized protein n=1 Tax=Bartonella melophagi K-2C TaxID=1094557 RepID=J1K2J8_9HYPH|nr:hypothetical protein [Bartonella melophagi]EJF91335.1 hypothetical protein ME3_00401 [Bartonella melophagi K-2C]